MIAPADRLHRLSPKQRALLEQRLRERQAGRTRDQIVPRPASLTEVPLSFAQQRLWFLDQLTPGSSAYNISAAVLIKGNLDPRRLQWSFDAVVARHEALRTTFTAALGEPVQRVAAPSRVVLARVDLGALGKEACEPEVLRLTADEAERPFDLECGPLLRVTLVQLVHGDHILLLTLHHIVSDGWSIRLLIRELTALYHALLDGVSPDEVLPPLAIQYADFALWQRERLQGEVLKAHLRHWRRCLEGAPADLNLPGDRPRSPMPSGRGGLRLLEIPVSRVLAMKAVGDGEGATLFMVLLAGLDALLHRYTGQEDLVLGTDVANRNRAELEPLIGFFVNELLLRVNLSGDPDFRTLLGRAREAALEAFAHQDLPFSKLVEELRPERNLSRTPLFQVLFSLHNLPALPERPADGGAEPHGQLHVEILPAAQRSAKFDLSVEVREGPMGLRVSAEYNADLFDTVTVDRLLGHLETLLAGAVNDPEIRVSRLPLLKEAERHQLLVEWNDSSVDFLGDLFHRLFDEQAAARPEAVAVACMGESRTYGELREQTDRLAQALAAEGLGLDDVVALFGNRDIGFLTAMIGIFKAGGAYLPLDPRYPAPHLARILAGSEARLAVVERRWIPVLEEVLRSLPPESRPRLLESESLLSRPDRPGRPTPPLAAASAANLAYVIFTSGSTGMPKGAMIQHRGMLNHLWAKVEALGMNASDRVAQTASQGFDISVWQFLAALLVGGRVHILPDEVAHDPARLADETDRQGITVLEAVPSLLRVLVDDLDYRGTGRPAMSALRWMIPTGEALPSELCRQWLRIFPRIPLLNAYGPTECSDDVCHHPVQSSPGAQGAQVPIGRPVANLRLHVLDRGGEPLPIGVPGELLVGGAGVGRGYLHEGRRTADSWVPDPFAGAPEARLYRTGDLARRRRDGSLDFLGRIDHQVKIRGHRIELGEIEAALSVHGGVREAVVLVDDGLTGGKGLVACVAQWAGEALAAEELRSFLSRWLPEPMVPSRFAFFESLPLTANGKVDRRELARTWREGAGTAEEPAGGVAPRNWIEELLAGIFAAVLRVEQVGAEDGFFDLGGHSLLATQVVSRVRNAFGVDLPLRTLFEHPRVAALAGEVEALLAAGRGLAAPPLRPVPLDRELPLSFAQQRLWLIDQLEPGRPLYNIPVALRVEGPLDSEVLALCLGEIVRRHTALRTIFTATEGSPVQVIQPAAPFRLSVADLSGLPERECEALALTLVGQEASRPFDLTCGPLLRGLLLRLAEGDHIVALTMHHIVSDGWSMGILVREVTALYTALAKAKPSPLPELPFQYADFAVWQHSWLHGEVLEREISFWRQQLSGLPPRLELPADRPRPAVQSFRGAIRPVRLPAELTRHVQALSRREGTTLFVVLLAGFQTLLVRYSGQRELAVGTPVAGRNRIEIEELIGFFVNTLVLRSDLTGEKVGEPSFRELIGRVRETSLAAYMHQDVPFEKVVQELSPERSLAQTPLFQVMFVLQNAPVENLDIENLRLRPVSIAGATAKFDLTLSLGEWSGELRGAMEHATDLFDAATIDRLIRHFEGLLAAAVATPDRSVSTLPLLSRSEHWQILREWNDTRVEGLAESCLHDAVSAQAARTPSAVAVELGAACWTYRHLVSSARHLARHLRELGVGPDVIVGLCAERSPAMVVGMLAVMEAGGAYLPLDPTYPTERMAFMLDDSGARVVLIQEHLLERVPVGDRRVVHLDTRWDSDEEIGGALQKEVTPDHLAYVIYTSGSTGRPKGVMVPHRGVCNRLRWAQEVYRLDDRDAVLQKASFGFDIAVWECFAPLFAGARLVLAEPGRQGEGPYLVRVLREHRVTLVDFGPSMLAVFLGEEDVEKCVSLRQIFVGGEVLTPELRDRALARLSVPLDNQYGPTEISIDTTRWVCTPGQESHRVPIGRPIANSRLYAVDPELQPTPIGVAGELLVGGAGLTRGYLRRPDLTAERFVPDPFSGDFGGRLYRTGDLVRWLPDGSLDFLGRLDRQVKIRGFRIELGEIEAVLSSLAGISQAVVVVREDTPGDPRLVAYVAGDAPAGALRQSLRERLPDFMMPAAIVTLATLPLTPNGKVDRNALPAPEWQRPQDYQALRTPLEEALARIWAELLGLEQVGAADQFFELGGHSLLLVRVQARIAKELGREVSLVDLFRYPTVRALAGFLEPGTEAPSLSPRNRAISPETRRIAIIGMAGRFPGASGVEAFWQNLCGGVESISFHTDADLAAAGIDPALRSSSNFVPAGGVLEGIELFDAGFFGYTPRDAEITDPQHRLFLECAWEALEGAGYIPEGCPGPVGVFAGVGRSDYLRNLISNPEIFQSMGAYRIGIATDKDFLTTNVSYKLDLKGPSLSIQTACSTSLVAVHVACRSLLAGECDMALAGGVSIAVPQRAGYLYQEGEINSPDGHCRAFDAGAQGTVRGSGVGVVVLKRLDDALTDGDPIHAVILGSAINNDGSGKVGYMAPSVDGQAEVIRAALEAGGVDPRTVGYIEAHGTGTPLGDPIEIAALTQAFREAGADERGFCAIGSVKANIGHLDTAAGVAGLIKAALTVQRGLIPPSLHFESPNPAIDFAASPYRVNDRLQIWRPDGLPRRAGVSSFGIGGTNAHAVLEEAPPAEPSGPARRHELLLLSARTPAALEEATRNLADFLMAHPDASLPDVAWTLQVGRRAFEHRRMLVCEGLADAVAHLREPFRPERVFTRRQEPGRRAVAFLFPGQGAQYPDMGRELYEEEPVFRAELDACSERLVPFLDRDLRELLFPLAERREEAARELRQTRFAQPALFAVELALARLWISWGIRPAAMIGHSLGEYVAACLAGVFSPGDALELVAARGALMQELPPGAMLSVELSEGELAPELGAAPELSLAAVNAVSRCVVSGPEEAVASLEARLAEKDVQVRRLRTSHAFHSAMMNPVLAAFAQRVTRISRNPPAIPFISNLTGTWITAAQATDSGYWVRHLRETVRFAEGIATLLAGSRAALLEVGPGGTLSDLVRRQREAAAQPTPISTLPRAGATEPGSAVLLGALGRLWLSGVEVDWRAVHSGKRRRRIPLPTYPFERQRFWVEASPYGLARIPVAERRHFTVVGGDPDELLARTLQAGGHKVESARSATDLAGLFTDPRSSEALERLLALEPGIRVVLPQAPKAMGVPEAGAPAARIEPLAGHQRPDFSPHWQAPSNDVERRIAVIWRDLLGIAEVGAHDNFFELGGDSLLATRVMSRVREAFGQELPINSLYDTPTLAGLAERIKAGMPAGEVAPPLAPADRSGPLPLSFAQQRLLYLHLLSPGETAYNLPLGLRLSGPLDPTALAEALRRLSGRHEVLRTTFAVDEERISQIVSPIVERGGLPWIDLSALPQVAAQTESRRIAGEDSALPFDLLHEPVWRAFLMRLAPEEHTLVLTFHHVAADGWSFSILFKETVDLYESLVEARPPRLPELPVQYADFAIWQRSWLQGEILERLLGYWQRQLAGLPTLDLPVDRARPAVRTGRGGVRFSLVPLEPVESLRRLAHQEDATLFMALSAAFSLLLRRDSGSDDIVLGADIANRTRRETEGLIGLFVNQIVLRHDLSGDPSFRELLRRVRRVTLEAYAHQDAPFDKLVEILNPPRDASRTPLFQVKIVLQNTPSETRTLRGLAVSALGLHRQTAKFDLLLNLTERASGLACEMEYSSDLYESTTIDRLLDRLTAVLRTVAEQPDARLGEIDRILGLSDLQTREERARGRRSQAIRRVQHRRNTSLIR